MLLLLESQNFRTKFLDYSGNEHKNFVAQFKRYVYEVEAEEGRSDLESLKLCGQIVGRLISAENNTPEKVNGVVTKYVFPLIEDFKTLSTNEKFKELKDREQEAIELDEKNAKPRPDREPQAAQNPFQALFNGLLGGPRAPEPDLDEDIVGNLAQNLFKVPEPAPAEPAPVNNAPPPPNIFQTLFGIPPEQILPQVPTVQAPIVVLDRSLFRLNWAFRICVYLSTVFDSETAFTTLSIIDAHFIQATIRELERSLNNRNEEEFTRRAKLVEAATTQLLSTVLTSLLNSKGQQLAEIKIEAEEEDPADESAAQFETMAQNAPAQNPIFNLLNMLGPNQNGRAREQLEEQRRQQGIRIRLLLNKQRQLEYVRKLSQRMLQGNEIAQTNEIAIVETKLSAKAVEIIDLVWDSLEGADEHRTTIQNCLALVETGEHEFGVQAAFALLTALFRVSAKKDGTRITNFLDGNKRFMDSMERKFTVLAEREDALYNFLLLAVEANPTTAFQVLTLVIDLFRSYTPEINEEDIKKRFFASRLVLTAMSSQEASKNSIIELVKKDWSLPVQLAVYLINTMDDRKEQQASQNVFLALSLILGNEAANIMKVLEHKEVTSFPAFLVNALKNTSTPTSEACLRMLNGMFDPTALKTSDDVETLQKFALSLIEGGIVDILSFWRREDGSKKPIEFLTPWEKTSGLTVVEVIAVSGLTDLLKEKENAFVIPNLLEFLIQSPSSQLAGTLLSLEPDFSAEASGIAEKQLSKFPVFAEALAKEVKVAERQTSDGDIVMRRVRGLPFQVNTERKYALDFKETISTIAVQPVEGFKGTSIEGQSIYFEAVVSSNSYSNSEDGEERTIFGKVGLISSNFKQGLFEGQLSKGVGDDKFSCGVVVKSSDVIGVKVNLSKGSIVFRRNGKTVLKEKSDDIITEIEKNGFFPAISGKNLSCVVNLGQMPFKFAPNNNKWISYKNFVGA